VSLLRKIFAHPLTRNLDLDDPRTTLLRRQIIATKPFLRKIYEEWYGLIAEAIPAGAEPALELGSGAGFIKEHIPNLITSEFFPVEGVDLTLDACGPWPFEDHALRAVVMTNVFHHLPDVRAFFREATRCIKPCGVIAMIEPWNNAWARLVYRHLHHKSFDPAAPDWRFASQGPLSSANGALPWIVFERDLKRFRREYPSWCVEEITAHMPVSYLLSGGVSLRTLMPGSCYRLVRRCEELSCEQWSGIFAFLVVRQSKRERGANNTESRDMACNQLG
jgi:SAM-dependent methyltransferase